VVGEIYLLRNSFFFFFHQSGEMYDWFVLGLLNDVFLVPQFIYHEDDIRKMDELIEELQTMW
jgi:hypothetical protein